MIPEALAELGDKAKVHIVLDGPTAQQFGVAPGQAQVPVRADLNGVKRGPRSASCWTPTI